MPVPIIGGGILGPQAAAAAAPRVVTFLGTTSGYSSVGAPFNQIGNFNIGSASAGRFIIVTTHHHGNGDVADVICAGDSTSMVKIAGGHVGSGYGQEVWAGIVASGSGAQNCEVQWTGFHSVSTFWWSVTGLSSTTVKQTKFNYGNTTIAVDAGDLLISGQGVGASPTWTGSTTVPTETHNDVTTPISAGAYWDIVATNAAFALQSTGSNPVFAAATWA